MWLDNYMTNNTCPACQTQAKFTAGLPCTPKELNTWSMWGFQLLRRVRRCGERVDEEGDPMTAPASGPLVDGPPGARVAWHRPRHVNHARSRRHHRTARAASPAVLRQPQQVPRRHSGELLALLDDRDSEIARLRAERGV